jgi:hypothetical protein
MIVTGLNEKGARVKRDQGGLGGLGGPIPTSSLARHRNKGIKRTFVGEQGSSEAGLWLSPSGATLLR